MFISATKERENIIGSFEGTFGMKKWSINPVENPKDYWHWKQISFNLYEKSFSQSQTFLLFLCSKLLSKQEALLERKVFVGSSGRKQKTSSRCFHSEFGWSVGGKILFWTISVSLKVVPMALKALQSDKTKPKEKLEISRSVAQKLCGWRRFGWNFHRLGWKQLTCSEKFLIELKSLRLS